MSWKDAAASALLIVTTVGSAFACDCPLPKGLTSNHERLAYQLSRAPVVASLRIDDLHLRMARRDDPRAIADAVVIEKIKGRIAGRIRVETWGGEEGANCGFASALFKAASERRLLKVALYAKPRTARTYEITNCSYSQMGEFGSADTQ